MYFDNNATTTMLPSARAAMFNWTKKCSNPSASNQNAKDAASMIQETRKLIAKECSFDVDKYSVIFTSGASESNCTIFRSVVDAWHSRVKTMPHIITSSIEHSSTIACLDDLSSRLGRLEVTYVNPDSTGRMDAKTISKYIKPNTCLVSIMYANNELGTINPVSEISKLVHKHGIPFHTDAVQGFGKCIIDVPKLGIDAMSVSMHKFGGPMGLGLLIISNKLIKGYKLHAQITGSQQAGFRGGTENVPAIAATQAAIKEVYTGRAKKNDKLIGLKKTLFTEFIKAGFPVGYGHGPIPAVPSVYVLSNKDHCLPNTALISFVGPKQYCNIKIKSALEKKGITVSIGSACNTSSPKASHVLHFTKTPAHIKSGVLRISFGDSNTESEVKKFVCVIKSIINSDKVYL